MLNMVIERVNTFQSDYLAGDSDVGDRRAARNRRYQSLFFLSCNRGGASPGTDNAATERTTWLCVQLRETESQVCSR